MPKCLRSSGGVDARRRVKCRDRSDFRGSERSATKATAADFAAAADLHGGNRSEDTHRGRRPD